MWALIRYEGMPPDVRSKEIDRNEDAAELYKRRDRENQVALARFGSHERRRFGVMPVPQESN